MAKKNIGKHFDIYPMPVVIVGTVTDGKPNFMTAAWLTKLHSDPPLLGPVAWASGSTPPRASARPASSASAIPASTKRPSPTTWAWCTATKRTRAEHVEIFKGSLESAPMVRECPVSLECRVTQTIDLPHDYLFIGEVINVYATESVLTDGKVDPLKLGPSCSPCPTTATGLWASAWGRLGTSGRACSRSSAGGPLRG